MSRFAVLGTEISMTSDRIQFTGEPTGRAPLPDQTRLHRRRTRTHHGLYRTMLIAIRDRVIS